MATEPDKLAVELTNVPNIVAEVFAEKMAEAAARDLFSNQQYQEVADIGAAEVEARKIEGRMK